VPPCVRTRGHTHGMGRGTLEAAAEDYFPPPFGRGLYE
jgi:hypothetical protein